MSDKSTPRPWKMDGDHIWHFGESYESKSDPHRSSGIGIVKDLRDSPIAVANAELICKAVNQYDHVAELVEAAKDAMILLRKLRDDHYQLWQRVIDAEKGEKSPSLAVDVWDALRSALAKMEVQP